MPIDPNIALSGRAFLLPDVSEIQEGRLRARDLLQRQKLGDIELQAAEQGQADERVLREAWGRSGGDLRKVRDAVAGKISSRTMQALDTALAAQRKQGVELEGEELKNAAAKAQRIGSIFGAVTDDATKAQAVQQAASEGLLDREVAERLMQEPYEAIKGELAQFSQQALTAAQRATQQQQEGASKLAAEKFAFEKEQAGKGTADEQNFQKFYPGWLASKGITKPTAALEFEARSEFRKPQRAPVPGTDIPLPDDVLMQRKAIQAAGRDPTLQALRELQLKSFSSGELNPKQISTALQLSSNLKSHPAYTDMLDIYTGIQGVETGLGQKNGFGDITAINAFQRMVDPGATVREGDVALLQSGSALLDKILSDYPIQKLKAGAKLPDATRAAMLKTAKELYSRRAKNYNETVGKQYRDLSKAASIPFQYVGRDFEEAGAATTGSVSVTAPNGQVYTFPDQEKADAFKKAAGIK